MTDTLVTVRLPPSLIREIHALTKEQHYVDQSELIRSVLRQKYEKAMHGRVDRVADAIVQDIKQSTIAKSEARLSEELERIRERLREELK